MLLLLLIYVVLRALWKIDVYLISTLVNKKSLLLLLLLLLLLYNFPILKDHIAMY